jgi:hypothetical protein
MGELRRLTQFKDKAEMAWGVLAQPSECGGVLKKPKLLVRGSGRLSDKTL